MVKNCVKSLGVSLSDIFKQVFPIVVEDLIDVVPQRLVTIEEIFKIDPNHVGIDGHLTRQCLNKSLPSILSFFIVNQRCELQICCKEELGLTPRRAKRYSLMTMVQGPVPLMGSNKTFPSSSY
jgi:hypothetical protein